MFQASKSKNTTSKIFPIFKGSLHLILLNWVIQLVYTWSRTVATTFVYYYLLLFLTYSSPPKKCDFPVLQDQMTTPRLLNAIHKFQCLSTARQIETGTYEILQKIRCYIIFTEKPKKVYKVVTYCIAILNFDLAAHAVYTCSRDVYICEMAVFTNPGSEK